MEGTILYPEPLYSLDNTALSSSYTLLAQLQNPSVIFQIQNLTNETITFSFDGQNDHLKLPANGFFLLDVSANKSLARSLNFQQGQTIYAKGTASAGEVTVTSFYVVR